MARQVQQILQRYKSLQDIIAILGMDELSEEDKIDGRPRAQDRALPVAAVLRRRGVHRAPRRVRRSRRHHPRLQGLCEGKYDHLPEAAFYMVGTIEQAVEKGKRLAAEAALAPWPRFISISCRRSGWSLPATSTRSTCRAVEGEFGVLAGHAPYVATLKPGMLVIVTGAERPRRIVVQRRLCRGQSRRSDDARGDRRPDADEFDPSTLDDADQGRGGGRRGRRR